jgi:lysozyme
MAALDKFGAVLRSPLGRRLALALSLSAAGVTAISTNEGRVHKAYLDPVAIVTICDGHTGPEVALGQVKTDAQCDELLKQDAHFAEQGVKKYVKALITQDQFDALVDFTFNVGVANLASSTLVRKLNAGDCAGAAAEFPRWNRAQGRVLPGLTTRREQERAKFEKDCP